MLHLLHYFYNTRSLLTYQSLLLYLSSDVPMILSPNDLRNPLDVPPDVKIAFHPIPVPPSGDVYSVEVAVPVIAFVVLNHVVVDFRANQRGAGSRPRFVVELVVFLHVQRLVEPPQLRFLVRQVVRRPVVVGLPARGHAFLRNLFETPRVELDLFDEAAVQTEPPVHLAQLQIASSLDSHASPRLEREVGVDEKTDQAGGDVVVQPEAVGGRHHPTLVDDGSRTTMTALTLDGDLVRELTHRGVPAVQKQFLVDVTLSTAPLLVELMELPSDPVDVGGNPGEVTVFVLASRPNGSVGNHRVDRHVLFSVGMPRVRVAGQRPARVTVHYRRSHPILYRVSVEVRFVLVVRYERLQPPVRALGANFRVDLVVDVIVSASCRAHDLVPRVPQILAQILVSHFFPQRLSPPVYATLPAGSAAALPVAEHRRRHPRRVEPYWFRRADERYVVVAPGSKEIVPICPSVVMIEGVSGIIHYADYLQAASAVQLQSSKINGSFPTVVPF